jgi:DNA transposition AAA+ family ATPase
MTKKDQPQTSGPVALKNVAMFMALAQALIDRDPHLPGIGVCSSPSGFGKTYASIFAQNKTGAIRVEVGDTWTKRTFLKAILKELGEPVRDRTPAADMAEKVIIALGNEPTRPLIVDEADKLVDRNMIETVRELHEHSGAPVILIGEERLPSKLLAVERVHNRVLRWMQALSCDLDDVKLLAGAFAPKLLIADDLLEAIRSQSMGRARRIVVNIANVAEFCRNKSLLQIDAAKYRGAFYTGEPPAPRNVQPFPRKVAA